MRIKIVLLATLLLVVNSIGFASNTSRENGVSRSAVYSGQPAQSPFAGNYTGEWTSTNTDEAREQHEGTWRISISADGQIKGTETDKTSAEKGELSGFIDEEGYTKVFVNYASGKVSIKGVLEIRGSRLTGTLEQTCNSSADICSNIDIILKRS
jgi:hypothetical protein